VVLLGVILAAELLDWGIFFVFMALAAAIVMVARLANMVKAHLPGISVEVGQISRSTNGVKDGEPKLIDQVRALGKGQAALHENQEKIKDNQHELRSGQLQLREAHHDLGTKLIDHIKQAGDELKGIDLKLSHHIEDESMDVKTVIAKLNEMASSITGPTGP
jgi:uncharacterized phage infection (PIP) family protein YhgE